MFQNKFKKLMAVTVGMSLTATAMGATSMDIIKKDKNNPLGNKPYAEVAIDANGACDYQILINDVPVYADMGAITVKYPINQYMINGENNLAIAIQNKDISCNVSASLVVSQSGNIQDKKTISKVEFDGYPNDATDKDIVDSTKAEKLVFEDGQFKPADNGYITVDNAKLETGKVYYGYNYDTQKRENMAGVKVSQNINLPIDLPKWAWESGETIENNQATKDQLIAIYKEIWNLIETKQWDKLNQMFALRDKEMAEAMYSGGKNGTTVLGENGIQEVAENNNLNIPPNNKVLNDASFLNIYANSRLAELTFDDGTKLLQFSVSSGSSNYGIKFAKINGKFVIVR